MILSAGKNQGSSQKLNESWFSHCTGGVGEICMESGGSITIRTNSKTKYNNYETKYHFFNP
jgi:hypothetical protein